MKKKVISITGDDNLTNECIEILSDHIPDIDVIKAEESCIDIKNSVAVRNLNIWNLLNYASFFVVILNKDFEILKANYLLATSLGFISEDELTGLNWSQFLTDYNKEIVQEIYNSLIEGDKNSFTEFTNDIVSNSGEIIPVKWFNSKINNGIRSTFNIGIPMTGVIKPEENIENVRAYWYDIIKQDRTVIESLKQLTIIKGKES